MCLGIGMCLYKLVFHAGITKFMTINLTTIEFSELIEDIYTSALTADWSSPLNKIMDVTAFKSGHNLDKYSNLYL